jgi:hypothetical protein
LDAKLKVTELELSVVITLPSASSSETWTAGVMDCPAVAVFGEVGGSWENTKWVAGPTTVNVTTSDPEAPVFPAEPPDPFAVALSTHWLESGLAVQFC